MDSLSSPCRPCRPCRRRRGRRGAGFSFSGSSVTIASVVRSRPRDGGRVLQRGAGHLGRIDDAGLDEVDVFAGRDVVAFVALALLDFAARRAAPSTPALSASCGGAASMARRMMSTPICLVAFELEVVERPSGRG